MYQNYTNRVKSFIFDMINPETKITINDDSKIIEEESKKGINNKTFIQKSPLIFKGYKNEKERIIKTIKNHQYLNGIYDSDGNLRIQTEKNRKIKSLKNILERNRQKYISPITKIDNNNQYSFIDKKINLYQRNNISIILDKFNQSKDFENLFDSLDNKYKTKSFFRKMKVLSEENKINHKRKINYDEIINIFEKKLGYNIETKKNQKKGKNNINQYIIKNKNINQMKSIKNDKKIIDNQDTMSSYHSKLHFKAAEEVAENQLDKRNKSLLLLPNIFKKNKLKTKQIFNFSDDNIEKNKNNDEEFYNSFYYKNPFKEINKKAIYNPNLMKKISKMAFQNNMNCQLLEKQNKKDDKINQTYDKKLGKSLNLKDENEVELDGKFYQKNTQFNLITKKVLQLCHFYSNKSQKNKRSLKVGDGKSMITKGMSVNNFMKKYKLK